ncbi:hypothetical protein V6N11_064716 [Hibiscus sabdariffa]|uniref:Uncharacterized protein n=1 Tax=Hibiscus sabdariffa TaxID=183260 RepID=A0ABR2NBK3_9ROSI
MSNPDSLQALTLAPSSMGGVSSRPPNDIIIVDDVGFKIYRNSGSRFVALSDIEAVTVEDDLDNPALALAETSGCAARVPKGNSKLVMAKQSMIAIVPVESREVVIPGSTSLNKDSHTVVRIKSADIDLLMSNKSENIRMGSTLGPGFKGGSKGGMWITTLPKPSAKRRKKVGKETEDAAISNRVDWLLSEFDQSERSLGQGDREMEPSEHVVDPTIQWSDNATCENRIRDAMQQ